MRWALWWFAVFAVYVITVEAEVGTEFIAGAVIALIAVAIVSAVLRNGEPDVRVRLRWLIRLRGVPLQMVRDALLVAGRILWALLRGERLAGYMTRVEFRPGDLRDPFDVGREALVIYGINAAPNTVVADVDQRGSLVVHQLISTSQPRESTEWPL